MRRNNPVVVLHFPLFSKLASLSAVILALVTAPGARAQDTGACCFGDKECEEMDVFGCLDIFGEYRGDGTTCNDCPLPMPTYFTYQGQLKQGGLPFNGNATISFTLWDHEVEGEQFGGPITLNNALIQSGLFETTLGFGVDHLNTNARWLEITICPQGGGCEMLSPRQAITPVPYALQTRGIMVDENQSVGLGTKFPETKLHVKGDIRSDNGEFQSWNNIILHPDVDGTGDDEVLFLDSFGSEVMRVDANGRLGIGTTMPDDPLSVVGSATVDAFDWNDGTINFGALKFGFGSGEAIASNRDPFGFNAFGLDFYTFFIPVMHIDNWGRVGIGTLDSSTQLTVETKEYSESPGQAIAGTSTFGGSSSAGVKGMSLSENGTGIIGICDSGSSAYGVWGISATGYAGYFSGDVHITGTLTQDTLRSQIDHPLDPENKTLSHAYVASPDMMNVYNGNATLDAGGTALVDLPDYFEALNAEFRYQLTAIGAAGPNLHIAKEISGNKFEIAGGAPGQKVSWQVTGVRKDAHAVQHRVPVVSEKVMR